MTLTRDGRLLFLTRFVRLFSYGMLAVVLVFYLTGLGLSESQTGLLLTLTLVGDTAISLLLTTQADRIGRRKMLIAGSVLMSAAGLAFAFTNNFMLLVVAGTIGVISPSGNEVGPFLPIEQAALSEVIPSRTRTSAFAWYSLTGSMATAAGSLFAGVLTDSLTKSAATPISGERTVVLVYAAMGAVLGVIFGMLSPGTEVHRTSDTPSKMKNLLGIGASRGVVLRLCGLFALDAFGGGFVVQSFAAYWFYLRFGVNPATLGGIFFGANVLAGISSLLATRLASRIGLVRTMVFTHLPSNVLLILVPLMPNLRLAILVLLLRFSISQMDVPTRQSYTMAVVAPEERSAAAGITGVARTTGAAIAPLFVGLLFSKPNLINLPFFIAGTLKIAYDLLLYRGFVDHQPAEEK
ncbi:MAG: major facilitator superfamily 1 [Candidatus Solibacter sp.]|nr:major facilitator superfamily 1 [Candidatus Solibacter sp.]